jgi:TRAP-type C4-dicarboxylate transport system substrate-binding protein
LVLAFPIEERHHPIGPSRVGAVRTVWKDAGMNIRQGHRSGRRPAIARRVRLAVLAALALPPVLAACGDVRAQAPAPAPLKLRVVGGIAGVNQFVLHEEPFWTRELARRSGGRYGADIVPFDRAGVPGHDMLTLMRLGVVPFGTVLLGQVVARHPELGAPDLAGLSPDVGTLRRAVAAFRPQLAQSLRDDHALELLAVYIYPAQVFFCTDTITSLKELAGRRIRVSSPTQADFVAALDAIPVSTAFTEIVPAMRSGRVQCAVTGAVSGRAIGLDEIARTVYAMPVSWGIALFAANRDAWQALPDDLRRLLREELPRLEAAIWDESERETGRPPTCGVGPDCRSGASSASPLVVWPSEAEQRKRRELFEREILPRWVQRCGAECARLWNRTLAATLGVKSPVAP